MITHEKRRDKKKTYPGINKCLDISFHFSAEKTFDNFKTVVSGTIKLKNSSAFVGYKIMEKIWNVLPNVWPFSSKIDESATKLVNLSRRDKEAVQTSWALARQDADAAGLGFFRA